MQVPACAGHSFGASVRLCLMVVIFYEVAAFIESPFRGTSGRLRQVTVL